MSTSYTNLQPPDPRDSLELGSLASSEPGARTSSESSSTAGISSSRKLSLEGDDPLDARNPAANARVPHNRSYSISSAFDFTSSIFPLSSTTGNGYAPIGAPISSSNGQTGMGGGSLEKHKTLTYLNGLSLVSGLIIGSGIFSSPSQVNINAGSPGASLVVWVIAGFLAWTGGSSFAELGGAIPLNGGAQVYLSKIFGEIFGFLYTWCAVTVMKPGSTAIITIIMGEYLVRAAIGAEAENVNPWINKSMAVLGLIAATAISCTSTRLGTRVGDMFMFLKFIALLAITVTGIIVAATGFSYDGAPNQDWKHGNWFEGTKSNASSWAVALYAGLWAFDGWDNVRQPDFFKISTDKSDELRCWRICQSQPRPPKGHPYSHAPRHHILRPRKFGLHPCSPHDGHQCVQHCSGDVWQQSIRAHRVPPSSLSSVRILLWSSQRYDFHDGKISICRRKGRISTCKIWQNRCWKRRCCNYSPHEELGCQTASKNPRRRRNRPLLHSRQRHAPKLPLDTLLRRRWRICHPSHILWSGKLYILLSDCTRINHLTSSRTESGTSIQDLDYYTHNLLLCKFVLSQ